MVRVASTKEHHTLKELSMLPPCSSSFPGPLTTLAEDEELGWMEEMFFPQQSSSAVLLASQGHVYLAKIKAASCVMSGRGGIDPGPFAVVRADK